MLKFRKILKDKKGATAIEYGLIAALIAVACIGALTTVGGELTNTFGTVGNELTAANTPSTTTGTGSGTGTTTTP